MNTEPQLQRAKSPFMLRKLTILIIFAASVCWGQDNIPGQTGPVIKATAFEPYLQPPAPALAGLWINTNPGIVWTGGNPVTLSSQRIQMQPNATNYVFLNLVTNTIQTNTSGFGTTIYPIAIVSTNSTQTTTVQDVRPDAESSGGSGGGAAIEVNGISTSNQNLVNFVNANGMVWSNPSGGIIQIAPPLNPTLVTVTDSVATGTGSSNAYGACPGSPSPTLGSGLMVHFIAGFANTSAATFNLCSGGAVAIVDGGASALSGGEIKANQDVSLQYTPAGNWQLLNPTLSTTGVVTSFTGGAGGARTGAVSVLNTDYGTVGIQQNGTGTLNILKNPAGNLVLSEAVSNGNNFMWFVSDNTGGTAILMQDVDLNQMSLEHSVGTASVIPKSHGYEMNANASGGSPGTKFFGNVTDIAFLIPGISATDLVGFDVNASQALFNLPVNFANNGFQLNGSYGTTGQCPVSTGTSVTWQNCASSTVASVTGTAGQIVATGSSSVVLSLAAPTIMPGNVQITQAANGNAAIPMTRATDTSPSGDFLIFRSAGLSTLGFIDVGVNFSGNSFTATQSGAGFSWLTQGTDNSASVPVNSIGMEAPATVASSYTVVLPGAGPSAASIPTDSALSGALTTRSYTPVSGTSGNNIVSGTTALASAASGIVLVGDGNGNAKPSTTNVAVLAGLTPIQGPGTNYTNATTSLTTAYSYTTSIPAGTLAQINCSGSY